MSAARGRAPVAHPSAPRIAIETKSLDRGGLETVVAELATGLPAAGIEPVVICTERGGAIATELRKAGVMVEVLGSGDRPAELAELLDRYDVRLLNAHYSTLGTPIAAARGVPVVVTLHNAYAWLPAGVLDEFRALDDRVDLYLAVSQSVADFCARRFSIDRGRIRVVRNGVRPRGGPVTPADRQQLRAELEIADGTELVVQIASISRIKCQLALVDAMAQLRAARPRLAAWIVGPEAEGDYADLVRQRIAEADLQERVRLLGARDDVDRLVRAADVFALPSVLEGLSLAAVEAIQAGVPVVLTRIGDAEFLLGDEADVGAHRAGELIDGPVLDPWLEDPESLKDLVSTEHPSHAPALAHAIDSILGDLVAYRSGAGARALELSRSLTPERMRDQTAVALLGVLASRNRHRADALTEALAREQSANRTLQQRVDSLTEHLGSLGGRVALLQHAIQGVAEDQARTLAISTRMLDKLRLTNRVREALRGWTGRLRPPSGEPPRRAPAPRVSGPPRSASLDVDSESRREAWLILAVVPFDDIGGAQRSAQLARALARRGTQVFYAARYPRSESVDLDVAVDVDRLDVLPWDPPAIQALLRDRDERLRVLIEVPEREAVLLARFAKDRGARVLYDRIDNWQVCSFATWFDEQAERDAIALADDLVASASLLARQLHTTHRSAHLVQNAVDVSRFYPLPSGEAPADLARGDVTLVYGGSLWGDWFDWSLVANVGAARPRWTINLIGDPPRSLPQALPSNVRLLGLKAQADLPPYYAAADACLIPFIPSPLVDAVSPLKVYEYLAMHRPVVSPPMPELTGLPYVFVASGVDATIAAVERAVATPPPSGELDRFVHANTWDQRAAALEAIVEQPTIAIVILCYNNRDVIERCIDSLREHGTGLRADIVVVDNGSEDGSIEILESYARSGLIRLLRNVRNGCSSGRNLGLRETRSEIVVFLDSDQWVTRDGWLDPALAILREHRGIGAVAWNAGWFDRLREPGATVDNLPERGMTGRYSNCAFRADVAYLATSGFVAPRSVLARTKGFDEAFDPTCFEDTDLSFQIKQLGYDLAFCPHIGVDHRPHQTTGSLANYRELLSRNSRYFQEKWRDRPDFFFDVPEAG